MSSAKPSKDLSQLPVGLREVAAKIDWVNADEASKYTSDPRDRFVGKCVPVLLPRSTQQASQLVKACFDSGVRIVPYGGGTGVVAGQLVFDAEDTIILSLEKMNVIRSISKEDAVIVAEAGCVLETVQKAVEEIDMMFPLAMASQGSAMIGGNLATNCGGIQVLRYGNARDLCLGIEAVMPDGSILSELTPLHKNNTGYDLKNLLIGSEGTLGIITAASLCLKPADKFKVTSFCLIDSPANALNLLHTLKSELGDRVSAFELMCDFGITVLQRHFPKEQFPLEQRGRWYALIEIGAGVGIEDRFQELLASQIEAGLVIDAVIAMSDAQRDALWRLREMTPEANRLNEAICSSDTSVPLSKIDEFIEQTYQAIEDVDAGLTINCYGHVGDGNIHFNVFPPKNVSKRYLLENDQAMIDDVRLAINKTTLSCKGSISAEHGIGRLKRDDLKNFSDPVKHSLLKTIKNAIDPKNIMNPGAML
ncbi:MAG: FAD-binding oxidoreductase [Hyphomicrobiales bacterium]